MGERAGKNISLTANRLRDWLSHGPAAIYLAKDNGVLVGYAIAIRLHVACYGTISWVTQLVVHEDYRNQGIAKNLLYSLWGFSDDFAWGLISANPYAIRALEKTTRRRCVPERIKKNSRKLLAIGKDYLPYIDETTELDITSNVSKINTLFFSDHSNVSSMIRNAETTGAPWLLGSLEEGWEWFAFTFQDQTQMELSAHEIENMLTASDQSVKEAYRRMVLSQDQTWMENVEHEIAFIMRECNLSPGDLVYDFGCGNGRHSFALAQNGVKVKAIDYIDSHFTAYRDLLEKQQNVEFFLDDCRTVRFEEKAKAAICLYDVIGSYADNEENKKIIRSLYDSIQPDGTLILSVMNYEMTEAFAKSRFSIVDRPNEILSLRPCNIMATTGNVFNPDFYLVDTVTQVIYRKEQFSRENDLPVELIVRDRRFTKREIETMCEDVGFTVELSRYVNAKDWVTGFEATDKKAKEILLKCRKKMEAPKNLFDFDDDYD